MAGRGRPRRLPARAAMEVGRGRITLPGAPARRRGGRRACTWSTIGRVDVAPVAGPKLLVVDDDAANLRTFVRVFRREYRIATAGSGDEALAVLGREPVDVALVDHSMPGMSGLELLRRMQRLHPAVRRVMLTAYGDLPDLRAAVETGLALAVVRKPWERRDIEDVIARAMRLPGAGGGGGR